MGTATIGTTSTTNSPRVFDAGYIMSSFKPNWSGNKDPGRDRAYYQVTKQEVYIRGEQGTSSCRVVAGSSFGDYGKADVLTGTIGTSFSLQEANVNYIVGDDIRYYAGARTTDADGIRVTRSTGATNFTVRAGTASGSTDFSDSQQYVKFTFYGLPSEPRFLSASATSATSISLSWSAPSDNGGDSISRYVIQRSVSGGSYSDLTTTTSTSYTDSSVSEQTTYSYRISAENGLQDENNFSPSLRGPYSSTASATTPSSVTRPEIDGSFASGQVNVGYYSFVSCDEPVDSWSRSGTLPSGLSGRASGQFYIVEGTPLTAESKTFTLTATNAGGFDEESRTITISPPPNPSWDDLTFNTAKEGTSYSDTITASNSTSVSGSGAPSGMSFTAVNSSTLRLEGTPDVSGQFNMTVTAVGQSGTTNDVETASITINPLTPPEWTDDVIENTFVVGTAYSDSVSASNTPQYEISAGQLPTNISLDSNTGALTGTPTQKQSYSFTIRAYNNDGEDTVSYSGVTSAPPIFEDTTLAEFEQDRDYEDAVQATSLTTPGTTYAVTSGALPPGITLNSTTGVIEGIPTGADTHTFTITATNPDGTDTVTFTKRVLAVPNWIDNILTAFIENVDYLDAVEATNSPTYAVSAGSLPTGITLNSSTGIVEGTPTVLDEQFDFTITASNVDGSISQSYSGSVQPDLGGGVKVYDGSAWVNREVYVYDGSAWVESKVHVYNGTSWIKSLF